MKSASKVPAKKTLAAKPVKKAAAKKTVAKPVAAKKLVAKPAVKKAVAKPQPKKAILSKKPVAQKAAPKKVLVKTPAPKAAPAKKAPAPKPVAKAASAKIPTAPPAKKSVAPVKPAAKPAAQPAVVSKAAAVKAMPAKPVEKAAPTATAKNASTASATNLFKGKVASATAMVKPRADEADQHHASPNKNQKNSSSSMNKLATKKLDNGVTREDGRYALPATSVIALPKGYKPSSKEEYMNPEHLAYFRNKLRDWRDQLVEESRQTMDNLRDEVRDVGDEAERATRETENSLELRTRDRYRKLISKIDKALRRIEDGSYGFCEETDEEIGVERLDARPIATLSLDAQERREHLQKQMGD